MFKYVVKHLVSSLRSAFLLAGAVGEFETWPPLRHKFFRDAINIGRRFPCLGCQSVITHVAVVLVSILLCVREIHDHISSRKLAVLTETLCRFSEYPQANTLALTKIRLRPLSSFLLPSIIQYLFYRPTPYNLRDLQASFNK